MDTARLGKKRESPDYVRVSTAAAITMELVPGKFFRGAKLYCINLLLTYGNGCFGRCAYCGLSKTRDTEKSWDEESFIRVDWPIVPLNEVISRIDSESCSLVERICVSMITNRRARSDLIAVVERLRSKRDSISALITPTLTTKSWLRELKEAGADMVGIAIDAATPELFEEVRGRGARGPHKWRKYWQTLEEAVDVFGKGNVGIHLIAGLGENEKDMVKTIQRASDMGARIHLFSFFPEKGSPMEKKKQPPIGRYRRIQLARYLIDQGMATAGEMKFDEEGRILGFSVDRETLDETIGSGFPFMTSGCPGRTMESACNRPYANCTPYQAYIGEMRNYPFKPTEDDIEVIREQLWDYSDTPTKVWIKGLGCEEDPG